MTGPECRRGDCNDCAWYVIEFLGWDENDRPSQPAYWCACECHKNKHHDYSEFRRR